MYQLMSPEFQGRIRTKGTGTTVTGVSSRNFKPIPLRVAPLDEQRCIVAEIEKQFTRLESGVAGLRRVQANLKRYRAAVLKAACEGKLVPTEAELARQEGRSYETGAQLLDRILTERRKKWQGRGKYKESVAPDIAYLSSVPDGWTWVSWEMVLAHEEGSFKRGPFGSALTKAIFVERGFKIYEQYCPINDDCSFARYYITPEKFEELRAFEVKAGDYLISCSGVTLGRITRVPEQFERGIINQALLRVRINEAVINHRYFLHLFRSALFQKAIFDNSTGSAIPNVKGAKELKDMAIPLPPLAEQTRIVAEVERRLSVVEELQAVVNANLQRATRLRQSILQKAFTEKLL
jgi:type I restriction enzyme S subunit